MLNQYYGPITICEQKDGYLNLPSLKYRRIRGDLIQLYKIVHNKDDLDYSHFFTYSNVTFTRGDRYKIYIRRCRTLVRQNSFIYRIVRIWNGLKFECKNAGTINGFKNFVDIELIAMKYCYDGF